MKMLLDFQAATNSAPWQIVNDEVMGSVSTSAFQSSLFTLLDEPGYRFGKRSPPRAARPSNARAGEPRSHPFAIP